VLGAGRFAGLWDVNIPAANAVHWESLGANEIHVHLLSRDETEAREIAADLTAALRDGQTTSAEAPVRRHVDKELERRSHQMKLPGVLAA
jgi:hypothetical protein